MVQKLHTLIKESSLGRNFKSSILWFNEEPVWATSTMLVCGDPQLEDYFGEYQLKHFREHLQYLGRDHALNDTLGFYPLKAEKGHLHIGEPKPVSEGYLYDIEKALGKTEARLHLKLDFERTVEREGDKYYQLAVSGEIMPEFDPEVVYLRGDQVDYLREIKPDLASIDITLIGTGIYFHNEKLLGILSPMNPALFKNQTINNSAET